MRWLKPVRWSGQQDRYWGPFTYVRAKAYSSFALMLGSGDHEGDSPCRLRLCLGRHTLILALPPVVRPHCRRIPQPHYEWAMDPESGVYEYHSREYGFSVAEGSVHCHYGAQTMDRATDRSWLWAMPWTRWRHVRRRFYDLRGEQVSELLDGRISYSHDPARWEREQAVEQAVPTAAYAFLDFDGEPLVAFCRLEQREWLRGTGRFKWLSWFYRRKARRSLDIRFSGETGQRKGSYKGGTVGTGTEVLPGELHQAAFQRYCAAYGLTFVGPAAP